MELFLIMLITSVILGIIHTFIRYNPKINIVYSKGNYEYFLWYNKYSYIDFGNRFEECCTGRKYIKLFTI